MIINNAVYLFYPMHSKNVHTIINTQLELIALWTAIKTRWLWTILVAKTGFTCQTGVKKSRQNVVLNEAVDQK